MSSARPLSAAFITAQPASRQCGRFKHPLGKVTGQRPGGIEQRADTP
jgi:hypothetical protein